MSNVKYPSRKMYILAALQPSEDATGGAWFTDGVLDQELLETLATALERKISEMSWRQVTESGENLAGSGSPPSRKRKEVPSGLNQNHGKDKMRRLTEGQDAGELAPAPAPAPSNTDKEASTNLGGPSNERQAPETRPKKTYVPHPAHYQKYPTLRELTEFVNDHDILQAGQIPENNIAQLLDVMVYDDRIIKIKPVSVHGSIPTMYKARKTVAQISAEMALLQQFRNTNLDEGKRMKAIREIEIQRLGMGARRRYHVEGALSSTCVRSVGLSTRTIANTLTSGLSS